MTNPHINRFEEPYYDVTRVEVIDGKGRSYTNWNVESLEFSLQDEGRTLKIFIKESKNAKKKPTWGDIQCLSRKA
jgi:hypothetical protein